MQDPVPLSVADAVAAAVVSLPGVSTLHAGQYGELALLYPGRRIPGLRLADGHLEVHVVLGLHILGTDTPLTALAESIRSAAQPHSPFPVDVIFADVLSSRPFPTDEPRTHP